MPGTKEGAAKARAKVLEQNPNHYSEIGKKGGKVSHPETRGFFTHRQRAREAGARGGRISRRAKDE